MINVCIPLVDFAIYVCMDGRNIHGWQELRWYPLYISSLGFTTNGAWHPLPIFNILSVMGFPNLMKLERWRG